ncbi:MAG: ABC transporter ATP-binding protein [Armatimonadetes bacterium]|nr:ABC transporter ATP-binding protein [Armatimonadota bacterium]MDE2205051.1 ABC transporter ATP-binding protein [Armatimonadota bacterium]
MIALNRVSRWYGQVLGINDVTCSLGPGITALLGQNGAGKSTMLKLITGQLRPTTGTLQVFGKTPFANPAVARTLGYCPESDGFYNDMTGRRFVALLAVMSGLRGAEINARVEEVIATVGMAENADRQLGGYSKGMKQRIKLAQAIVHRPEILVLDEPLNGLDPVGRREMGVIIHKMAEACKTIIVSSHILHEVEQMTRQILVLHHGRLMAIGDTVQIRGLIDAHPHHITMHADRPKELAKCLIDLPYVLAVRFNPQVPSVVEVETRSPDLFYVQFPELVLKHGFEISEFDSPDNNLEAVFKYLVGA